LFQGEYHLATQVLVNARERFPHEPISHAWIFCEQILCFTKAMHHAKWQEAGHAVARLAAINKWESKLRYFRIRSGAPGVLGDIHCFCH